ncbi:uncharacterized protein LOC111715356 isoform X2 [Eurytemora carolleeae]|uniref:uncharacterized protein LOC111715356 isoform X2 n=1 Tax=Eurytemora carolleeae TaxID=1294199 RepID=UPI000C77B951|nr:uncharacterized protein LOC111715356 isoform X2 [Eurytemora carolleeae]|eukprot:XP_023346437.1 uncharacterized protein LOC111715356 isoform X2 [Eurytemora affinis]
MIFLTSSPAFRPSHKDLPGPIPLLYLLEQTCAMPCLALILSSATLPETKQNLATYSQRCEVLLSKGHSGFSCYFFLSRYLSRTLISSRTLIPELNQDILGTDHEA